MKEMTFSLKTLLSLLNDRQTLCVAGVICLLLAIVGTAAVTILKYRKDTPKWVLWALGIITLLLVMGAQAAGNMMTYLTD